ncbi:MAG: hypothetical protein J6V80_07615, partial [Clostridia bacterium]|nr:hypothetical protein [Clostridia bacterium]
DFAKMWQKPITPEEESRRERAARAVQGIAGLGNLMSAFANLTFTGKGVVIVAVYTGDAASPENRIEIRMLID